MFGVIFDMDGTLLDTQRQCIPAWDFAGENQGYKNIGKFVPAVCGMNELGCRKFLKEKFPDMDIERFRTDTGRWYMENMTVEFKFGAPELIDYLKKRNIKIALATGTSRSSVMHQLKAVGISDVFDALVCGNEVQNGKPAPDIFLEAAREIGIKPKDCFVFEDSENGIIGGSKAGMKCIGIADIKPFSQETKKLMFKELDNLLQAVEIFEKIK